MEHSFSKGEALLEMTSSLGLTPKNEGSTLTYERNLTKSFINMTFASQQLIRQIDTWQVMKVDIQSDHNCMYFNREGRIQTSRKSDKVWSLRKINPDKLIAFLDFYDSDMLDDSSPGYLPALKKFP